MRSPTRRTWTRLALLLAVVTGCGERVLEVGPDWTATGLGWDPLPVCGDGVVEGSERCDDGNRQNDDGCDGDCVPSSIEQFVTGRDHTCVVTRHGQLRCFGGGDWGQNGTGLGVNLGDDEPASDAPFIPLGGKVEAVSAGWKHTCVLLDGGETARCFGHNRYAQLGYRNRWTLGDDERPIAAEPLLLGAPLRQLLASEYHTCGVDFDGRITCWGDSEDGQLGYGTSDRVFGPPVNLPHVQTTFDEDELDYIVGPGTHICARSLAGQVACWGRNENGELGYAHTENIGDDEMAWAAPPVWIGGVVEELVAGAMHNCVRLTTGEVKCWGSAKYGQVGYGNVLDVGDDEHPAEMPALPLPAPVVQLVGGSGHTCALLEGGRVRCWGKNDDGQLGLGHREEVGDTEPIDTVPDVDIGGTVVRLASAWRHTCALLDTGALRCWGWGALGQLGYGNANSIGDNETPASAGDVPLFAPAP